MPGRQTTTPTPSRWQNDRRLWKYYLAQNFVMNFIMVHWIKIDAMDNIIKLIFRFKQYKNTNFVSFGKTLMLYLTRRCGLAISVSQSVLLSESRVLRVRPGLNRQWICIPLAFWNPPQNHRRCLMNLNKFHYQLNFYELSLTKREINEVQNVVLILIEFSSV